MHVQQSTGNCNTFKLCTTAVTLMHLNMHTTSVAFMQLEGTGTLMQLEGNCDHTWQHGESARTTEHMQL